MKRRPGPYEIYDDYPENDENTLYLLSNRKMNFSDVLSNIEDHFGRCVDFSELEIESAKLHTRCVTYDLYDPTDWDEYIIISRA